MLSQGNIYESPDGGKTVYRRSFGSPHRELITQPVIHWKARWYEWEDILKIADQHPSLRDAIEKAEMIYQLIKDHK